MVTEECEVRCGTVILGVAEGACPPVDIAHGAPATGDGPDQEGAPSSVLLHFQSGYVHMLEVYRHDGESIRGLPDPTKTVFFGTKSANS